MKSILKKIAGIAICAALALGMIGCSAESEDNLALLGILNGSGSSHEHTFADEWTNDATHHWHAATCGHTAEVKDKAEHTFGEWIVVTHPSEDAVGLRKRTCSECQYVAEEVMPKLDHTHAKGTFHAAVAGTCKAKSKVAYYDCTKEGCEEKLDEEGNVLTTIEGDFGPHVLGTKHDAVLGTCKTKASLEYYECATESCTEKLDKDLNVLVLTEGALDPANHESEETTFETIDADNHKEMHKCCNAVITASAAHIWNSGVVTKAPSTTEEGVKTFTCTATGCGQTKTEVIAMLNTYEQFVDAATGGAVTEGTEYIYFGVFPQTILPKTSSVTIDENVSVEMGGSSYYIGSDGNYYAKVTTKKNSATYANFSDGSTPTNSEVRYFKVEPIKWKILTKNYNNTGRALLHAVNALTANVPFYGPYVPDRTIDEKTVYPNNYKYSTLRAYLNGKYENGDTQTNTSYTGKGFLQMAFTSTAQALIAETEVDNSAETTGFSEATCTADYACENTIDKIFLLSMSEVINSNYGFGAFDSTKDASGRIRVATDYAIANNVRQGSTAGDGGRWFMRSPFYEVKDKMRYVDTSGTTGNSTSEMSMPVNQEYFGIVPALTLDL